ncbi:MAG: phytoene desaturase [Flavobacteriales bacterium]|nr:phytoene desaturase [Flavobacteriales bacterium]
MATGPRAVVIGSGVGGLAAAIRLACSGHSVDVFEAADGPGGKLSEFRIGGYRFDRGPSLFTRPDLIEELFQLAGVPVEAHFRHQRLDEANRYFWEDGTRLTAWSDPERMAREMEARLGVDARRVLRYLERSADLMQSTGSTFLEHSLHAWSDLRKGDVPGAMRRIRWPELFGSLHDVNRKELGHDKAVQLFDRYATYNGSDPFRTPGLMRMIPALEHGDGVFLPKGGMYSITRALHELAERVGVRFHFNAPVERILLGPEGRSVQGVQVNGAPHSADVVMSNMDVVPTYRHLLPDTPAPERILRQERSSSAIVFYWGVRTVHPDLGLHNILFTKDSRAEFRSLFQDLTVCDDPTVYINITSIHEPGDAPTGRSNWFTMVNAPRDAGQFGPELIQRVRRQVMDKVQRTLGLDLSPLIEVEEVLDAPAIQQLTSSHAGSLYGTASNSPLSAFLRHPNFHRRTKGLFFCGGSVHPGGGIPLALLSARIAAYFANSRTHAPA